MNYFIITTITEEKKSSTILRRWGFNSTFNPNKLMELLINRIIFLPLFSSNRRKTKVDAPEKVFFFVPLTIEVLLVTEFRYSIISTITSSTLLLLLQ